MTALAVLAAFASPWLLVALYYGRWTALGTLNFTLRVTIGRAISHDAAHGAGNPGWRPWWHGKHKRGTWRIVRMGADGRPR